MKHLLVFQNIREGIQEVSLNTKQLYANEIEYQLFHDRLLKFLDAEPIHSKIFSIKGDVLIYLTEHIIPKKHDLRPPILMLFGNPAPQSVDAEMYFASHTNGSEHRIWKVLEEVDFLSFEYDLQNITERNRLRKRDLYELAYHSPFRIGLAVYYSMPSPASGPWSGVAGLKKLFGAKAFKKLGEYERHRVEKVINEFVSPVGSVIAFQKDAYLGIKSFRSPDYALAQAKQGKLLGNCQCDTEVKLFCCPPTRLIQTRESLEALKLFKQTILNVI